MNLIINELKLNKEVKHAWVLFISIFMFVLADTSYYSVNVLTGTTRLIISILIVAFVLLSTKGSNNTYKQFFVLFVLLTSIVLSSLLYESIESGIILIICMLPAYFISTRCSFRLLIDSYNYIIYFLALWALIVMLITYIQPGLISLFPTITSNTRDYSVYNLFFSVMPMNSYVIRNYGIFWEPGTFSIFLNLGLLFNLFGSTKIDKKKVIILILAIISTFSTLGIVCMCLLGFAFLLNTSRYVSIKTKLILFMISIIAVVCVLIYGDNFLFHVFGKLSDDDNASTLTRTASIMYVGEAFLENWLAGIGMYNFNVLQESKCFNMATCTPLNWIAVYGIIGFIYIVGLLKFFLKFSTNIFTKCMFVVFGLLLFSTENFLQIPFVYYLVFGGFKSESITYA